MADCCEGSGSGSGPSVCGPDECTLTCDQCLAGTSWVWELAVTGYDTPIYLCYVSAPDDGNYCTWASVDLAWLLKYNYDDDLWSLENLDTGDFFYLAGGSWDCGGENVLINIIEEGDPAVLTPVYDCSEVSYNCSSGHCVGIAGSSGAYATLGECEAACGGGIDVACCDVPVPTLLTAAWTNLTGACTGCLQGGTMVYQGGGSWATPYLSMCPSSGYTGTERVVLDCDTVDIEWVPSVTCLGATASFTLVSQSCSPFELVYDVTITPFGGGPFGCCNGAAGGGRLTISG